MSVRPELWGLNPDPGEYLVIYYALVVFIFVG